MRKSCSNLITTGRLQQLDTVQGQVGCTCRSGVDELEDLLQYFLLNLLHNDPVFARQSVALLVIVVVVDLALDVVADHRSEHSRGLSQLVFVGLVLVCSREEEEVRLPPAVSQVGLRSGAGGTGEPQSRGGRSIN